jgi:hypothetical protein
VSNYYIAEDCLYITELPQPVCELSQGTDIVQIRSVEGAWAVIQSLQRMIQSVEEKHIGRSV